MLSKRYALNMARIRKFKETCKFAVTDIPETSNENFKSIFILNRRFQAYCHVLSGSGVGTKLSSK
jgi:hypothetical protein